MQRIKYAGIQMLKNKLVRLIVGGHWIKVHPQGKECTCETGKCGCYWIRPTFPEATKMICNVADEEEYNHSIYRDQHQIGNHIS